jgi:hypothetical protein
MSFLAVRWLKSCSFGFAEELACVSGKTKCAILIGWHFGSFFCRFNVALSVVTGLPPTNRYCCCAGIFVRPDRNRSPINIIKLKVTTNRQIENRQARAAVDSEQKDENLFVSQHSSKPHVVRSLIICQASCSF